jgi:CIC family chloride channel protein
MLKAKDIMQTNLVVVNKDTSFTEAIELIAEHRITGLPVVKNGMGLAGIVSEKDLLGLTYYLITGDFDRVKDHTVESIMTTDVVTFRPDDNLADICQCFIENPFRRVPIVEGHRLVGLITRKDLIFNSVGKDRLIAMMHKFE